ncbi:MAG: hypothetical protein Fur0010_27890 [Bdellovibrio sp.]
MHLEMTKTYLNSYPFNYRSTTATIHTALWILLAILGTGMSLRLDWSISYNLFFHEKEYWRALSSLFAHANFQHLLSNLFMLAPLSFFLSKYHGAKTTWIASLIGGVLTNLIVITFYNDQTRLLGISGIVFFMWGMWLALYIFIEKRESLIRRIMKASMIYLVLLIPGEFNPQVSYLAHFVGNMMGLIFGGLVYLLNNKFYRSHDRWKIIFDDEDELKQLPEHII